METYWKGPAAVERTVNGERHVSETGKASLERFAPAYCRPLDGGDELRCCRRKPATGGSRRHFAAGAGWDWSGCRNLGQCRHRSDGTDRQGRRNDSATRHHTAGNRSAFLFDRSAKITSSPEDAGFSEPGSQDLAKWLGGFFVAGRTGIIDLFGLVTGGVSNDRGADHTQRRPSV